MQVRAFVGPSNSGKTTIVTQLIRHYVAQGRTVAAIKHTHHQINDERRGDTERFLQAGASPVILAGDGAAIIFEEGARPADVAPYTSPLDLLQHFSADIVFVEGFKDFDGWPRIDAERVRSIEDALALLDKIS